MQPKLDNLDQKSIDQFPNKVVRKSYAISIPEFKKLPTYVSEFLISIYADENGNLRQDAIERIVETMKLKAHEKKSKEALKSLALELGSIELIDHFEVYTDLHRGKYFTHISILDEKATVNRDLLSPTRFQPLLKGGLWGKAKFQHIKQGDFASLNMDQFESYQTSNVILKNYVISRSQFSTEEWIDFLIRSMGFNPKAFNKEQKLMYLARLLPMVEECLNLLELGPPGTGKSFIYENASEYCRVLLGGEISPAKLIYDQISRRIGLVFKKDVLCFDEINKKNTRLNDIIPKLQQIMASNRVERGELEAMTQVSIVFQGNIDFQLKENEARPKEEDYLKILPKDMYNSAFLDRIHLFIHGWEFPRIAEDHLNENLGLISNYFGQILHKLRKEHVSYLIDEEIEFYKIDREGNKKGISIRDKNALYHIISGLIKLIFPNKIIIKNEWIEIVDFAIKLRQNVITEMEKIDNTLGRSLRYNFVDEISVPESSTIHEDINSIEEAQKSINPPNSEEYQLDLLKISVNEDNFLVKKIPYFLLKLLVEEEQIIVENRKFKLKTESNSDFQIERINESSIEIFESLQTISKNYSDEEDELINIEKKLEELLKAIKRYGVIKKKIAIVTTRHDYLEHNVEINKLIEEFEQKTMHIQNIATYFTRVIENKINSIITMIQKGRGLEPDLLSHDYSPIINEKEKVLNQIKNRIELWEKINLKFNPVSELYTRIYSHIKERNDEIKKSKLIFNGAKFPLFAFDVNNLIISFNKKYPHTYRRKESPIMKIKKKFLKDKPYLAKFFTTDHLRSELNMIPLDEYNEFYIEQTYKDRSKGLFVDVDTALAAHTYHLIEIYKDQLTHFYLGSGDKDFHFIIEKAKENNIPVSIIIVDESNLSTDMAQLIPDSNIHILY